MVAFARDMLVGTLLGEVPFGAIAVWDARGGCWTLECPRGGQWQCGVSRGAPPCEVECPWELQSGLQVEAVDH